MVAERSRTLPATHPDSEEGDAPGSTPPPDFSAYARPIDRGRAGIEGGRGYARPVPLVLHEAFKRPARLSLAERKELLIKQAALRILSGFEFKSYRELAREIGCSHTAIDNQLRRLCDRLGLRKFCVSDTTRARLRAARARQLARPALVKI